MIVDKTVIDSYPRYENYKDSGIDWLGDIPEEWNLTPAFKFINENKLKNKGLTVDTVLSLSYGNILIKPKEKLTGLVPESFETYQIVEPNDIIIRCMDLQNDKTSLRIGLVKDKGIITSAYLGLKVGNSYLPEYLYYYLHSLDTSKAIYKMGTGLRQNLSFGDFKRFQVPNISLKVQQNIVNFVKTKTTKIDQAITLKQQQIAKLEEYKQIVIQNAVTKGLNPDVPMKDSGIDWISDIPKHWEVKKLKFLCRFDTGNKDTVNAVDGGKYPLFVRSDNIESINEYTHECEAVMTSGDGAGVGKIYHYYNGKFCFHQRVYMFNRFNKVTGKFFYNYFSSLFMNVALDGSAKSTVDSLRRSKIANFWFAVPPKTEQEQIVSHIDSLNASFDKTLMSYKTQIDRLKEYKTILINQAVTGKIKVR